MRLPNLLIIGAGRAGTTSLYHYLGQHPDVFMSPIKESNYFAYRVLEAEGGPSSAESSTAFPVRSWEQYGRLFATASAEKIVGEASPRYMAEERVAREIAGVLPRTRLIAILRNPVERAYSSYLFHCRDGREHRSFERAIQDECNRSAEPTLSYGQRHYLRLGLYDRLLAPYFALFSKSQIGIFLFDDLIRDPRALVRDVLRFLEVDPAFEADVGTRYNASGLPRSSWARAAFRKRTWLVRAKRSLPGPARHRIDRWIEALRAPTLEVPPLASITRQRLASFYASDIRRLEVRLGLDLGGWLSSEQDRDGSFARRRTSDPER